MIVGYENREGRCGPKPSSLLRDVCDVIIGSGARIGEAVGLRWEYVTLTPGAASVTIAGKISEDKGVRKQYEPHLKTEDGWRTIPITDGLASMLRLRKLRSGGNPYVFFTSSGAPNGPQDVHRALRNVREWASLPPEMVPHTLRKSAITVVADELGIEAAAIFSGHRRSSVTEHFYAKRPKSAPDARVALQRLERAHGNRTG